MGRKGHHRLDQIGGTCRSRAEEKGFWRRVLVAALLLMNKVVVEETLRQRLEEEEEEGGGRDGYQNPKRGNRCFIPLSMEFRVAQCTKKREEIISLCLCGFGRVIMKA